MDIRFSRLLKGLLSLTLLVTASATTSEAAVVYITQARAMVGGITPGDAPGFPVTISRPGSYQLLSNLVLPSAPNTIGIQITAESVTLDLNGFAIIGPRVCPDETEYYCPPHSEAPFSGITGGRNVTVMNGTVRGSTSVAIALGAHARVERVNLLWSSHFGLIAGRGSIVVDSLFAQNGQGAYIDDESRVTGCTFRRNIFTSLQLWGASAGYNNNILLDTTSPIGGTPLGPNICEGPGCP
jgi:hypothetical protein